MSLIAVKVTGHPAVSSGSVPLYFIKPHWLLVAEQFYRIVTQRLPVRVPAPAGNTTSSFSHVLCETT